MTGEAEVKKKNKLRFAVLEYKYGVKGISEVTVG